MEPNLGHAYDVLAVLSVNADERDGVWWPNMARRINEFFGLMSKPDDGGA